MNSKVKELVLSLNDLLDGPGVEGALYWSAMKALPLHRTYEFEQNKDVTFTKILEEKRHMRFYCTIAPGASIDKHMHFDFDEVIEVLSGELYEGVLRVVKKVGEKSVCSRGIYHKLINNSPDNPLILLVDIFE